MLENCIKEATREWLRVALFFWQKKSQRILAGGNASNSQSAIREVDFLEHQRYPVSTARVKLKAKNFARLGCPLMLNRIISEELRKVKKLLSIFDFLAALFIASTKRFGSSSDVLFNSAEISLIVWNRKEIAVDWGNSVFKQKLMNLSFHEYEPYGVEVGFLTINNFLNLSYRKTITLHCGSPIYEILAMDFFCPEQHSEIRNPYLHHDQQKRWY